jgi:branched-chain amino acid transport system ATP-binding protein
VGNSNCWLLRALCGRPKLLLLDEPTEGIQLSIVDEIGDLLLGLNRDHGLAIVLIEQNIDFVAKLASNIAVIQKGVIVRNVDGEELGDESFIKELVGIA